MDVTREANGVRELYILEYKRKSSFNLSNNKHIILVITVVILYIKHYRTAEAKLELGLDKYQRPPQSISHGGDKLSLPDPIVSPKGFFVTIHRGPTRSLLGK